MNRRQRMLWRAALAIAGVYARRQEGPCPAAEPLPIDAAMRLTRLLRHARRRGYRLAASRFRPRLERALRDLGAAATSQAERLRAERTFSQPPLAGTLYWDLRAIDDEFPRLEINFERGQLLIATDPIELDGVALGPFMICLDWEMLGEEHPLFEVMALGPNTASSNSSVTHPHIVDDRLCEGEATSMLRAASLGGRLHDFVLIVRQVLQTYNESSAYVSLDRWYGIPCGECGTYVDPEERCICGRCDEEMCDECARNCGDCGDTLCHRCCDECTACEDYSCFSCLKPCDDCHQSCCSQCLTEGVCDACTREKEAAAEAAAEEAAAGEATPVAEADPVCVGQAPVHA